MGRASRARKVATTAAYGGGSAATAVVGAGALFYGLLRVEAKIARRTVGTPFEQAPVADGVYDAHGLVRGRAPRPSDLRFAVIGDSSAAGLGVDHPAETPAALIATGLAAASGRAVRLVNVAVSGAVSSDLAGQLERLAAPMPTPDVTVVMIGANDVTHRVRPSRAVGDLVDAVTALRGLGSGVVVGTCPDLGTIEPVPQPLRLLARKWSRDLAAAQTVAVVEAGGRTVSLGDLLGPEFAAHPTEMFSADRFHPSARGYAKAAGALLPSVCAELDIWPDGGCERLPDFRRGEAVEPVSRAAVRAVRDPGTEVSASEPGGALGARGRRGPLAVLLRRRQQPVASAADAVDAARPTLDAAEPVAGAEDSPVSAT